MTKQRNFTIRIFVAEGDPTGLRLVQKSNWTGLGIICPRGRYADRKVQDRPEFSRSGVYVLTGQGEEDNHPTIYIGEGETVGTRLAQHYRDKEFWQQAFVFTSNADPLNKAHVQFLEACLYERALETKRCKLENSQRPSRPKLSDADRADVEGYLDEMLELFPLLGVDAFQHVTVASSAGDDDLYYFSSKDGKAWKAIGYETNNGFAVKKDSLVKSRETKTFPLSYRNIRSLLRDDGVLIPQDGGQLAFAKDHEFSSPSLAASIVAGTRYGGPVTWKDRNGVTLGERRQHRLESQDDRAETRAQ